MQNRHSIGVPGPQGAPGTPADTSSLVTTNTTQNVTGRKDFNDARSGVTTPTQPLSLVPKSYADGLITTHNAAADPHADRQYVQARGDNLFANGSGLMDSNYNMTGFTLDKTDTHGGLGSFTANVAQQSRMSDEYIPVDPLKGYEFSLWAKAGNADGSMFNAASNQSWGIACYDADRKSIDFMHRVKQEGSADTTLVNALNPGDTTMVLTDATGWYNGAAVTQRLFAWWPYTNDLGYSYPNYTYSRNVSYNSISRPQYNNGTWAAGGISGNTITLAGAWNGPALPAGTPVQNIRQGATYVYFHSLSGSNALNTSWRNLRATTYGQNSGKLATRDAHLLPVGTAYVRLLWLVNYHGAADNIVKYSDITVTEHGALTNDASARFRTLTAGTHYVSNHVVWTEGTYFLNASAGNIIIVLPTASEGPLNPFKLTFVRTDNSANTITFTRGVAGNVNGVPTLSGHMTAQFSSRQFTHNQVDWFISGGMGA